MKDSTQQPAELVAFDEFFTVCRFFFKSIGIHLQLDHAGPPLGKWRGRFKALYFWLSFWNLAITYVGELVFFVLGFGTIGSFLQLTALAPCIAFVHLSLDQILLVHRRRHQLEAIIGFLEQDFAKTAADQQRQNIAGRRRQHIRVMVGFAVSFVTLIVTFNFIPFVVTVAQFLMQGRALEKQLPYFVWYPFDEYDTRIFPVIYLLQSWAGFTCVLSIAAMTVLMATVSILICLTFERIALDLSGLHDDDDITTRLPDVRTVDRLRTLVRQHIAVIQVTEAFERTLSASIAIQYIISSLVICLVGFQVVAGDSLDDIIKFVLFLFCSLIQTYIISHYGNEIIEYVSTQ